MIKGLMLQTLAYGEGAIGEWLNVMAEQGFFTYLLPFLLIFAMIFAILERIKIFKGNKSINGIIALVIGLMALQFDFVSVFFAEIFPRLGVALVIILMILILTGLFVNPKSNAINYVILGIAAIIGIIVLIQTAGAVGWSSAIWWYDNWQTVAVVVTFIVIIAAIIGSGKEGESDENESIFVRGISKS